MKLKNKKLILLCLLFILIIPVGITLSKFVNQFRDYYLMHASNFYFSSDKLTNPGTNYKQNNWGGVGSFEIQFELNNHKNNLLTSDSDIEYRIELNCSQDITCAINSDSGVIYKTELTDDFVITVTPQRVFNTNETISINVVASSISPYEKTLSATFEMTVGKKGISYELNDVKNQTYLTFAITNALDEYTVRNAFGSYHVGDVISSSTYLSLTDEDKAKCYSARIRLRFNPRVVIIDSTSEIMKTANVNTTRVNGIDYVSYIEFDVDAVSSTIIRFYKIDTSQDYTNDFSIISYT